MLYSPPEIYIHNRENFGRLWVLCYYFWGSTIIILCFQEFAYYAILAQALALVSKFGISSHFCCFIFLFPPSHPLPTGWEVFQAALRQRLKFNASAGASMHKHMSTCISQSYAFQYMFICIGMMLGWYRNYAEHLPLELSF